VRCDAVVPCCSLPHWQFGIVDQPKSMTLQQMEMEDERPLRRALLLHAAAATAINAGGAINACVCVGETDHSLCSLQFYVP
jgi:hypothetical protein